jgi:hypothetical protein
MAINGTVTEGYLYFNAEAGKTYEIKITGTSGEFSSVQDAVTGDYENNSFTGGNPFDGTPMTFTASRNFQAKIYLDGGNVISFEALATSDDVESMLADALASVKTYVDAKDASVKTYADNLIAQLMNTTDLQAKLDLLAEINAILDGDTATAGFQLWESSVSKLNQIATDFEANKTAVTQQIEIVTTTVQSLDFRLTNEINVIKSSASTPFSSLKTKAASIFAV